jgi:hypothetical protein
MQTFQITDPKVARRCRFAQLRGEKATVILDGLPVTGIVQSIKEDKSSFTPRWSITVAPKQGIAAQR